MGKEAKLAIVPPTGAKPRRKGRGKKKEDPRSATATTIAVGSGAVVSGGAVLALQRYTNIDDRWFSGGASALGVAAAIGGALTDSPNVRDVGIGIATANIPMFVSDLISTDPADSGISGRNAAADPKALTAAIQAELQKAGAQKPAAPKPIQTFTGAPGARP